MRRRDFLKTAAGAVTFWPFATYAQRSAIPIVGVLHGVAAAQWADRMVGFHKGLGEVGFVEGRNLAIEYRWAEGQFDRLPAMAADLVSRKVAVILAGASDVAIRAAMAATKTIPIVFTTASDPVRAGFVGSVSRPEGNATGITFMGVDLVAKRMELLHEVVPDAKRIAVLVNPNNPGLMQDNIQLSETALNRLGLEMITVKAGSGDEIESAVLRAVQQQAGALSIGNDAYLSSQSADCCLRASPCSTNDVRISRRRRCWLANELRPQPGRYFSASWKVCRAHSQR